MHLAVDGAVFEIPSTGIAKVTAGLCRACIEYDPTLAISVLHRQPLHHLFTPPIQTRAILPFLPHQVWRRVAFLAERAADAVYFPWNGMVPRLPSHQTVVTMIHDVLPLSIPGHFQSIAEEQEYRTGVQRDIERTHLLFTCSEYSRQQLYTNFTLRHEPALLRYGPTLTLPEPPDQARTQTHEPYFLYVGGYDKRKGIEQLLRVFLDLHREKQLTSRLILTGSKRYFSEPFRKLIEAGREMKIVDEKGYVDEATLTSLLQGATALVYPSKYEGFGLPPIEAMTAGCPVLTTPYTSLPEVCGDAALYVDPDDAPAFGHALMSLERDSRLTQSLRQRGFKQAQTFTWHDAAETFLERIRFARKEQRRA